MSEFKFACPICGQHITADSSTSGGQIECPTCFQKIIVPQAPASGDAKFILSAAQVGKPRPSSAEALSLSGPLESPTGSRMGPVLAALLLLVCAVGAGVFVFRDKIFKTNREQAQAKSKQKAVVAPRTVYPIPTNFTWTLELTNADFPETTAAGSIHGSGFFCERATLQGGNLTMRQGKSSQADLGVTVRFFAKAGEELSGKVLEVAPDRLPPLPTVVLRWKDEQQQPKSQNIN